VAEDWDRIFACVLRPARPERARCLRALEEHVAASEAFAVSKRRALADIEARIQTTRDAVVASGTGVVPASMTELERAWLTASRTSSGADDLERLWVSVAPPRWRDAPRRVASAEAIVTLASDPDGVEEAERLARVVSKALAPWGVDIGPSVKWCVAHEVMYAVRAEKLFAAPLAALGDVADHVSLQAAHRHRRAVREGLLRAIEVSKDGRTIARELGDLAFASKLWNDVGTRLATTSADASPFAPAIALFRTGYVLTAADASGVTLTATPLAA
jgi:hypothetical protein